MIRRIMGQEDFNPKIQFVSDYGTLTCTIEMIEDLKAQGKNWKDTLSAEDLRIVEDATKNQEFLDIANKPRKAYKDAIDLKEVLGTYDLDFVEFIDSFEDCRTRSLGIKVPTDQFVIYYETGTIVRSIVEKIKKEHKEYLRHVLAKDPFMLDEIDKIKTQIYELSFYQALNEDHTAECTDVKIRYKFSQ